MLSVAEDTAVVTMNSPQLHTHALNMQKMGPSVSGRDRGEVHGSLPLTVGLFVIDRIRESRERLNHYLQLSAH